MKVIGIIGFKRSGKTTLGLRLSKAFLSMGYRVGVLKHAGEIDFPESDTAKYREHVPIVSAVAPAESEIIIKGEKTLGEMLKYFESDIVLAEGFKREKTFPKIVCLRDEDEKKELFDGLELFTASFHKDISDFDILNDDHVMKMAAVAFERGFKLPELNCAHCGYETCYELAREIVQGNESTEQCVSLNPPISVKVDGDPFALNHYTSNLFKNTILAMVSSLKGYKKGTIEIEIP